jgi:protocatechuate 3,4-dioxygenase beta subunit
MHPHDDARHDLGLAADLQTLTQQAARRRQALRWLLAGGTSSAGLLGTLGLPGCGGEGGGDVVAATTDSASSSGSGSGGTTGGSGSSGSSGSSCTVIPEETAGPYPGDGSNSAGAGIANALLLSGIVRSDIRSSIAGASGVASGVPLTVRLQLVNTNASCAALAGYAIYLWHCDAAGRYSMYSSGVTAENYLRGVQATDSSGTVSFTTIYPGCYSGRVPHLHLEVYRNTTTASSGSNKIKTSQLAFPVATSQAVYASSGYSASVANLAAISFATDNVFSDGVSTQLASMSGDTTSGYVATLQVGIAV